MGRLITDDEKIHALLKQLKDREAEIERLKQQLKRAITYMEAPGDKRFIKECDSIIEDSKKLL